MAESRTTQEFLISANGRPVPARAGQSVAGALMEAGIRSWRLTRKDSKPRGLFCGIGVCFDCLITVAGVPDQRACLVQTTPGLEVTFEEAHHDA